MSRDLKARDTALPRILIPDWLLGEGGAFTEFIDAHH